MGKLTISSRRLLSAKQLTELQQLEKEAFDTDQNRIPLYLHILKKERQLPSVILAHQDGQLIGFLSIFFFYDKAAEVSLIVSPAHRRKHVAKKLLATLLTQLDSSRVETLIFSVASSKLKPWLTSRDFSYVNSEFEMIRENLSPLHPKATPLDIRPAIEADIATLNEIDKACFSSFETSAPPQFYSILHDADYSVYIASLNHIPIGKVHIRWQDAELAQIHDLCVIPTAQHQGFGRTLLLYGINEAVKAKRTTVQLTVETSNTQALSLYQNADFKIINACDYSSILFKTLTHKVYSE